MVMARVRQGHPLAPSVRNHLVRCCFWGGLGRGGAGACTAGSRSVTGWPWVGRRVWVRGGGGGGVHPPGAPPRLGRYAGRGTHIQGRMALGQVSYTHLSCRTHLGGVADLAERAGPSLPPCLPPCSGCPSLPAPPRPSTPALLLVTPPPTHPPTPSPPHPPTHLPPPPTPPTPPHPLTHPPPTCPCRRRWLWMACARCASPSAC